MGGQKLGGVRHPSPFGYFAGMLRDARGASRRTPQSPFGGQACALTKTVHPAQFAGQVTGGTGSWLRR